MKHLAFLVMLLASGLVYGQVIESIPVSSGTHSEQSSLYDYTFTIQGIESSGQAKHLIIDDLRDVFNFPEAPYEFFPKFIDKGFQFSSSKNVNQKELEAIILELGYKLLSFEKNKH